MIYFLKAEGIDRVKIGHTGGPCSSQDIRRRILELRGGCPIPTIHCLGMMEGDLDREREIHRMFRHLHSHCEWFNVSPELMQFIEEHTIPYGGTPPVNRRLCWKRGE